MDEWQKTTIGAVATIYDGPHATPRTVDHGPVFLGISALQKGRLDLTETRHVTAKDYVTWTRRIRPQAEDVVFSYETRIGEAAIIPEGLDCCLGRRMGLVRTHRTLLDPWFFLYFYLAPPFQEFLRSRTIPGATVDRIALKEFPSFPIVLPPMVEQRRIVSALRAIDDKIELNRRMNETLEAMARTIFKDWFVDFGPTRAKMQGSAPYLAADIWALFPDRLDSEGKPDGWQTKPFLDSTSLLSGGTPKTDRADFWGGEIAWASAKDVSQCGETFLFDTERCITDAGLTGSSTRMIPAYATVVVARGATTGRFCMSGQEMAMKQTCYALKSKNDHNFWTNCAFAQLVEGLVHAAHGSVFDTITTDTFQRTSFINDDRAKDAFEVLVRPLFTRISANIADNRSLAATRDLLLPKLISGEVSIRDAKTKVAAAA